ncbi:vacuolar ATPase assembly integral membrane protein VMA21 homolog isoform X2 [Orussus abietinus]|uniref:vacuolar ATPase assembly integral membrane protein VMA21 homolog isoform X2 n=1 Tax=Orussus abietinus TaxID=222816 RepID=UPI00062538EB|nr:vacuolar ATPase assembly integral membrane protein VMA21 homolog isoform X2 [Orussus abietinus]
MADELPELRAFRIVFFHCLVIITLPVLSFFTSKIFLFDGLLGLDTIPSNVYAAGIAVIVLHAALGAFIYKAYFDTQPKISSKSD